jgi:outer membrane lipoprotein-sorting protein
MREMRTRTDQSAQAPRFSFVMVLSIISAILFVSGCGHKVSPEQFSADMKARTDKIQNDPSLTPQQKQQAILQLEVQTGQLPPSALHQSP